MYKTKNWEHIIPIKERSYEEIIINNTKAPNDKLVNNLGKRYFNFILAKNKLFKDSINKNINIPIPNKQIRLSSKPKVKNGKLILNVDITDYGMYIGTVLSSIKYDKKIGEAIKEISRNKFGNENALFHNPIGNVIWIETSDNYILLIKRGNVSDYPSYYDVPGGHPKEEEFFDSKKLFYSVCRESSEEVNLDPKQLMNKIKLIGISTDLNRFGKPDLLFKTKIPLTKKEIINLKSNKFEVKEKIMLKTDNLFKIRFLSKSKMKFVPPADALLVASYHLLGYNFDKIKEIEKI